MQSLTKRDALTGELGTSQIKLEKERYFPYKTLQIGGTPIKLWELAVQNHQFQKFFNLFKLRVHNVSHTHSLRDASRPSRCERCNFFKSQFLALGQFQTHTHRFLIKCKPNKTNKKNGITSFF